MHKTRKELKEKESHQKITNKFDLKKKRLLD